MTTPENATTWRDLADQLSDATRFALELLEQETQGDARAKLLALARDDIETRLADAGYCDIPAPAGASVGEWEHNTAGGWSRSLVWASFGEPGGISVDIDGRQECDGTYTRRISVWGWNTAASSPVPALGGWPPCLSRPLTRWTGGLQR
jgi:hypothetical protein